jgi:DNA-binding transcriptional LysR family regulator
MRFTLKQLRYFDAAIRNGSIAKAAAEMNISQSSITASIDAMEQTVGTELFRRVPAKGVQPTEAGHTVAARVAEFMEQARVFESDLMSLSGDPTGTLHMGCYAPTAPYVLPRVLKHLSKIYPTIRIDLKEDNLEALLDLLQSGRIDLALTYRRRGAEGGPFQPLFLARPWALLPLDSPLAAKDSVALSDLSGLPMVLLDLPTAKAYFRGVFREHGLDLNVVHTTKSSSVLRGLVAAGFGYSILNICAKADRDGSNGYIARPIAGQVDTPEFGVAYTQASRRSTIVQAVLDISADLARQGIFDDLILSPDSGNSAKI